MPDAAWATIGTVLVAIIGAASAIIISKDRGKISRLEEAVKRSEQLHAECLQDHKAQVAENHNLRLAIEGLNKRHDDQQAMIIQLQIELRQLEKDNA